MKLNSSQLAAIFAGIAAIVASIGVAIQQTQCIPTV